MIEITNYRRLMSIFVLILTLFLLGCTSDCGGFENYVSNVLKDERSNEKDKFSKIYSYYEQNKAGLDECLNIDEETNEKNQVYAFINRVAQKNGYDELEVKPDANQKLSKDLRFKFYLESSASMWNYDRNNEGEFKTTIVELLNRIVRVSGDDSLMYIVNREIVPLKLTFNEFIVTNDIFGHTRELGDPSFTDFRLIFEQIFDNLKDNEISIMVSDMVYSTPEMAGKTKERIANEVEGLTQNVFSKYADDNSLLITKMTGTYNGKYYYFDEDTESERYFLYEGKRPFYLLIFGKNQAFDYLLTEGKYSRIANYETLPGYEDYYLFKNNESTSPYYSILMRHPLEKATYQPSKSKEKFIHSIENVAPARYEDKFEIVIGVDLSGYNLSETYKTDINNFEINNPNYIIETVEQIENDYSRPEKGSATHYLVIRSNSTKHLSGDLSITFKNELAPWINKSSTLTDTNRDRPGFENTTFAFESLMKGIHTAYYAYDIDDSFFKITLQLKN